MLTMVTSAPCRLLQRLLKALGLLDTVHYINGPEVLPAPLSKAEEEKVFIELSAGESTARKTLIVHNLRLDVYKRQRHGARLV